MLNRAASVAIAVAVLVGVAWVSYSIFTRPGAPPSAAQPEAKGAKKATPEYLETQRTPVDGERGGAAESARVAGTVLQPDGQPAAKPRKPFEEVFAFDRWE